MMKKSAGYAMIKYPEKLLGKLISLLEKEFVACEIFWKRLIPALR